MSGTVSWARHHRLVTFSTLAYLLAWGPWVLYELGVVPEEGAFFAAGPLVAALVVIALADGRAGCRQLLSRLFRWRVGWVWYVVAIGLPALLVVATGLVNTWFGAPTPDFAAMVWVDVALVLALRLVNPLDGALGEEPGWRGYALPRLQAQWSPLGAAAVLGVLSAGWHLPIVVLGDLSLVALPTTPAITFLYVWVFDRTGGSLLMTLLFHASQGAFTYGMLGFEGADERRADVVYSRSCSSRWRPRSPSTGSPGPSPLGRRSRPCPSPTSWSAADAGPAPLPRDTAPPSGVAAAFRARGSGRRRPHCSLTTRIARERGLGGTARNRY